MERLQHTYEVSVKELEQIIFLSYMFSQGSISLQTSLVIAISKIIGHQDTSRTIKVYDKFAESLRFDEDSGLSLSRAQSHTAVAADPKLHYGDISHLTHENSPHAEVDYQEIVNDMWQQDYVYLCEQSDGRPNRDHKNFKSDTIQDPYFSFGVAYLLGDRNTPSNAFNRLLEQLREHDVSEHIQSKKEAVVAMYQKHHQETPE